MSDVIRIAWQTPIMPAPAFDYFHAACVEGHEFKSDAIKNGKRTELHHSDVGSDAKCVLCGGKLMP